MSDNREQLIARWRKTYVAFFEAMERNGWPIKEARELDAIRNSAPVDQSLGFVRPVNPATRHVWEYIDNLRELRNEGVHRGWLTMTPEEQRLAELRAEADERQRKYNEGVMKRIRESEKADGTLPIPPNVAALRAEQLRQLRQAAG